MDFVWCELRKYEDHEVFEDEFFATTALIRKRWPRLSKTPGKYLEGNLKEIATMATKLARKIVAHDADIQLAISLPANLSRLIIQHIENHPKLHETDKSFIKQQLKSLSSYHDEDFLPSLPDILNQFAKQFQRPFFCAQDYQLRPTKIGAATAERTYAVRVLDRFFLDYCDYARHDLIAPTITTMFDLADNPMTVDHVAKLI